MRVLSSVTKCRNVIRCHAPLTRALSDSPNTTKASLSSAAPLVATNTSYSNHVNPVYTESGHSSKILHVDADVKRKIHFLSTNTDFFSHINDITESQVYVRTKASHLELTGLQHDIHLCEDILKRQLSAIDSVTVPLLLQSGAVLGLYSTNKLATVAKTSSNVMVNLSYNENLSETVIHATGLRKDVNDFHKELLQLINSVHFETLPISKELLSSKAFTMLYKDLVHLPKTVISVSHGYVNVWTTDKSQLKLVQDAFKEFTSPVTNTRTTQKIIVNAEEAEFLMYSYKFDPKLESSVQAHDSNSVAIEITGLQSEVTKAVSEIRNLSYRVLSHSVDIPSHLIGAMDNFKQLNFGQEGKGVIVHKPTETNPRLNIRCFSGLINSLFLEIYNRLQLECSSEDMEVLKPSLMYKYRNYEEFRDDEKTIQLFGITYPEVVVEWKNGSDGSIYVKVSSSPDVLSQINGMLQNFATFPLSPTSGTFGIASVLLDNGKLGAEVKLENQGDVMTVVAPDATGLHKVLEVLDETLNVQQLTYHRHDTSCELLAPGQLCGDIREAARDLEVLVSFPDRKNGSFTVDFVGREGNCELFRRYLDLKLSNLSRVKMSFKTLDFAAQLSADEKNMFTLYSPDKDTYWFGGNEWSVQNAISTVEKNFSDFKRSTLSYPDPRMTEYFRKKVDAIKLKYPKASININEGTTEIFVVATSSDLQNITDMLESLISDCAVFSAEMSQSDYTEGREKIFRTIACNNLLSSDDKVSFKLLCSEKEGMVNLEMVAGKSSLVRAIQCFNRMGDPNLSASLTSKYIELPYANQYFFNCLQQQLGLENVNQIKALFGIHSLWKPLVSLTKMWMWRSLDQSPDRRDPWRIRLEGEPSDIDSVNRTIQRAIKNVHFHRLKFRIIGDVTKKKVKRARSPNYSDGSSHLKLENMDFMKDAIESGEIQFYEEFFDDSKNECFLNIFGDDPDKVNKIAARLRAFAPSGDISVTHINFNDHVGKAMPVKNCYFSTLCRDLDEHRDRVSTWYDKLENRLTVMGPPDLVDQIREQAVSWVKNLTQGSKKYDDIRLVGAKVRHVKYLDYMRRRWQRLSFGVGKRHGTVYYYGNPEDVQEFEKYLSNEVMTTFSDKGSIDHDNMAALLSKLSVLYPGVFIGENQNDVTLIGERSEVRDVENILKSFTQDGCLADLSFKLNYNSRAIDIPYDNVSHVLGGLKMKTYWPELTHYISDCQIKFVGPDKDIEECSDILSNMVTWDVPDTSLMSSKTLLYDYYTSQNEFRDSHFIPPEVFDKLFIIRHKGSATPHSNHVTVKGRPQDVERLSRYIEEELPRQELVREDLSVTQEEAVFLNRQKWLSLFPYLSKKVSYSFDQSMENMEIVGDASSVSQVVATVRRTLNERHSIGVTTPTSTNTKKAKAKIEAIDKMTEHSVFGLYLNTGE